MTRLLIIEDELLIAAMTESVVKSFGHEVTAVAQNLQEAIWQVSEGNFDVAIVDINLGNGLEGLEVGALLQSLGKPFFYLTSYESGEIIKQASLTKPGTYLIKPFSPAQLLASLQVTLANSHKPERLVLKLQDGLVRHQLYLDEILYVQADNVHIDIHTKSQRITLRMTLKTFRDLVPEDQFIQPHRSYLVNLENVSRITPSEIWLGQEMVPISRTLKADVSERMGKHAHLKP